MAITATAVQNSGGGWAVNAYSADASGCEEIKAAPGAGNNLEVHSLTLNCATAISVTVGAGETDGSVTSILVGPVVFTATGQTFTRVFNPPILLAANTSLTIDASGAGPILAIVQGKTI
jgi:hypothetical protein